MGEDIGEKLLLRIQELFRKSVMDDENIRLFLDSVKAGKAVQQDCLRYAERLGEHLSRAFAEVLTAENLPNGTLYFNIANKTILPMLREAHIDINTQASAVQKAIDRALHIGLQPLSGSFPESRVRDLMYTMCKPDLPQQKKEAYLKEPIVNTCASFFDDFVRENADFRFRSGMSPVIIRTAAEGCCEWCSKLAGAYPYEKVKSTGHGAFRRHENCRCVTTFEYGRKSQNVWSKKQWAAEPDELERRKTLAQKKKGKQP